MGVKFCLGGRGADIEFITMKYLIIVSILAIVAAEPEAELLNLGPHSTHGFVRYPNGAMVPEDTASVKAAKTLHHTSKTTAKFNGYSAPYPYLLKVLAPKKIEEPTETEKIIATPIFNQFGIVNPLIYTHNNVPAVVGVERTPLVNAPVVSPVPVVHTPVFKTVPAVYTSTLTHVPTVGRWYGKRSANADAEANAYYRGYYGWGGYRGYRGYYGGYRGYYWG